MGKHIEQVQHQGNRILFYGFRSDYVKLSVYYRDFKIGLKFLGKASESISFFDFSKCNNYLDAEKRLCFGVQMNKYESRPCEVRLMNVSSV